MPKRFHKPNTAPPATAPLSVVPDEEKFKMQAWRRTVTIRVLVVDDYKPWLRFIRATLQELPELQVISDASDGQEAVQKAIQLQPDLILLDIGLPTLNGIEAARKIRERNPEAKILFLSEQRSQDVIAEALGTGSGYVVKSYAARELLHAVNALLNGRQFVSNGVADLTENREELPNAGNRRHEFYHEGRALEHGFAQFLGTALKNGDAVVVLASDSHRAAILEKLKVDGVDVCAAIDEQRYVPLDAAHSLHMFRFAEDLTTQAAVAAQQKGRRVGVA
jgi:DNA-binding NarL/FixJ family response regulator